MRRVFMWSLAGITSIALTILIFLPATWLASLLEIQTAGRLTLGDAQGTLWHGSAFVGAAPGSSDPITPLLPGRFIWQISPAVLLGKVDAVLENTASLSRQVKVTGNWKQWQVSPATITLPAERLTALGAPLNTIKPSGQMNLSWKLLQLTRKKDTLEITGVMKLELKDIASRLSPIKPLGAYDLVFNWHGQQADMVLKTVRGPMLLSGSGKINNGHFQFSGTAQADAGQEKKLGNLLNLLGQRRRQGGKEIIALEFK